MASGSIVGECPVCDEWICEDEWTFKGDVMVHVNCRSKLSVRVLNGIEQAKRFLELNGYEVIKKSE